MLKAAEDFLRRLPPLHSHKSPQLAAFIGFLVGGVGLGLYFLSFIDALVPLAILLVLAVAGKAAALEPFSLIGGALIAALYGYWRATTSNQARSAALDAPGPASAAEVPDR